MKNQPTAQFPALLVAARALLAPAAALADFVPVHGGPAYNQTTQTGYQSPDLPVAPGATAGNGMAVGVGGIKYVGGQGFGTRAVRWDTSGNAAVELGNLGADSRGATNSGAYAVNATGTVVGYADKYSGGTFLDRRAVRWDASGTAATELGNLGTDSRGMSNSTAFAINAGGTAVGVAYKYAGDTLLGTRAVRWNAGGTAATELGILATDGFGSSTAAAWAVNDAGTAVGFAHNNHDRPVRWDAGGTAVTELQSLDAGTRNAQGEALAINTSGTAVGYSYKYTGRPFESDLGTRAVRWDAGGTAATELGTLGTDSTGHAYGKAYAVNDAGTAVGVAGKYTDAGKSLFTRAVRWDAGGSAATELGNLGADADGITNTVANAINSAGFTVGEAHQYTGGLFVGRRAVLWGPDAVAIDLNTLIDPAGGWTLTEARGISDTNWITGVGLFDPDGVGPLPFYSRAFLLDASTAVPEPVSGLTMFLASVLLTPRRTRRRTDRSAPVARPPVQLLEDRRLLSFGPATNYDTSYGPRSVDVGDFNRDGRPDVVCATSFSGVAVRLNNGNGTLADEVLYPLGQNPLTTVVGDLNGDDKLDAVATAWSSRFDGYSTDPDGNLIPNYVSEGHVRVLLGNGDGTFAVSPAIYDAGGPRPFDAALGDLDADGDLDLVLANLDGSASVLPGNGDGTFGARQAVAVPGTQDVDLADLDADGKLDLIAGSAFGNTLSVLRGNGNGTFQPARTVASFTFEGQPVSGMFQALGDVNGDGALDLAVTYDRFYGFNDGYDGDISYAVGSVAVLLGNGDATFTVGNSYPIGPGYIAHALLADVTGDGKPDVVAGGEFTGNVALLAGRGDGVFDAPEFSPAGSVRGGPYDVASADLDGNGTLDVVTANYGWNTMSVLLNGAAPLPALSIGDVTVTEGNSGTRSATFTVSLSAPSGQPVTVAYATADGTAAAGSDYGATSGTLTIPAGQTTGSITVPVVGDRAGESDEVFLLNLSRPNHTFIADGLGVGTIADDEPRIRISNVFKKEGRKGQTTSFAFTATLSAAYDQPVTASFSTADGTATAGDNDYVARTGTLTFAPGETSKTITISVRGDSKRERIEYFYLDLFGNSGNSLFTKKRGAGLILNDD